MADTRPEVLEHILVALRNSAVPDSYKNTLQSALLALFEVRPNAVDKVHLPLARALRNPAFPGIWTECVGDIPRSPLYADLRAAAEAIEAFVGKHRSS